MHILIIGSGSYVLGDLYGPGVVLRSILQWLETNKSIDEPCIVSMTLNTPSTAAAKQEEVAAIQKSLSIPNEKVSVQFVGTEQIDHLLASGEVDACFVSVPDKYHRDYVEAAMKHDIPVWVVKPLTGKSAQSQALVQLQEATNSMVWVDYHKRFDVSNLLLKKMVSDGTYGKLLAYSVDYHQPRTLPVDVFDWSSEVDVFTYIGCHYVDQLFFLYPEARLKSVVAEPLKGVVFRETGQFDGVLATLKLETNDGPIVSPMNIGWFNPLGAPTKSLQTLKVQFEKGLVELDQTRRGVHVWDDSGVAEINPYFFCETEDHFGKRRFEGYGYDSISTFLDMVIEGQDWYSNPSLPFLVEAAKTDDVVSCVQEALTTGESLFFDRN